MSRLENIKRLRAKVEQLTADADRAAGRLEEAQSHLMKEYEVATVEEAETLLAELREQHATAQKAYHEALEKFETKWEDVL